MCCLFGMDQRAVGRKQCQWPGKGLVALVCSLVMCLPGYAQTPASRRPQSAPSPPVQQAVTKPAQSAERVLELSLADAVRLALQNNLDIERERFGPLIARTDVEQARAAFDPTIGLDATLGQTKSLPTTEFLSTDAAGNPIFVPRRQFSKDGEVTPLFKQKIITGGNYEFRFVNIRQNISPTSSGSVSRTIQDPRFESHLELTFTQPLLRDFGIAVNTAPIQRAEKPKKLPPSRFCKVSSMWCLASSRAIGNWSFASGIWPPSVSRKSLLRISWRRTKCALSWVPSRRLNWCKQRRRSGYAKRM